METPGIYISQKFKKKLTGMLGYEATIPTIY